MVHRTLPHDNKACLIAGLLVMYGIPTLRAERERYDAERRVPFQRIPLFSGSSYGQDQEPDVGELRSQLGQTCVSMRAITQVTLAKEVGISRRIIAYYEVAAAYPPARLLREIATALKVTTDELRGHVPVQRTPKPRNTRLQRRLEQIEQRRPTEKRNVLQGLDAFIKRGPLRHRAR